MQKIELSGDGTTYYRRFNERSIVLAVNVITTMVAAVFLIGSIVTFYFLQGTVAKLVAITLFTIAFAVSIGLVTSARRVEIFAATAALVKASVADGMS